MHLCDIRELNPSGAARLVERLEGSAPKPDPALWRCEGRAGQELARPQVRRSRRRGSIPIRWTRGSSNPDDDDRRRRTPRRSDAGPDRPRGAGGAGAKGVAPAVHPPHHLRRRRGGDRGDQAWRARLSSQGRLAGSAGRGDSNRRRRRHPLQPRRHRAGGPRSRTARDPRSSFGHSCAAHQARARPARLDREWTKCNKESADALGTPEVTVKNQASSIFGKLGVRDRTRAVLRAIELGVL